MPRAPKLVQLTQQEHVLAREFLKEAIAPAIGGAKLAAATDSPWLVNPASNATYNVCLLPEPDTMTGMTQVVLDAATGDPLFGKAGATRLVLFDPFKGKVWVMVWAEFVKWIHAMYQNPQHASALMRVRRETDGLHVGIHMDWAVGAGLTKTPHELEKGEYAKWRDKKLVTPEQFCHLHCHSMYSLLDGASSINGIAQQAAMNGQPGIALTDHGYLFGTFKHWQACKEHGVKAMMGVEAYVVDDVTKKYATADGTQRRFEHHQTIIAMNQVGWENLCILMTAACRDHFHYVPRIDHQMLFKHHEGLFVLSGCFKGMAAHYLQKREPRENETELPWWLVRDPARAREHVRHYKTVFGDRYGGELMNIDYAPYMAVVPELMQMFADEKVPTYITNDCHYEREEDAILQAVLSRISNSKVDGLGDAMRDKGPYYIRSKAEMQVGAPWATEDMFTRTCQVMERCTLSFDRKGYLFPPYDLTSDADWTRFKAASPGGTHV